jgi:hypothetical protein
MGIHIGNIKISRVHEFQRATLLASGKSIFIFKDWALKPEPLTPEYWAWVSDHKEHSARISLEMNADDPIEFFNLRVNAGKPIPAARCGDVADAFELLRPDLAAMDREDFKGWDVEQIAPYTMEFHLDAHITHLRACAKAKKSFQYSI